MSCSDTFGSLFSRVVPYDNIRYHSTTCHQNVLMYVESLCSFHWLPRLCHPVFNLVFQAVKLFLGRVESATDFLHGTDKICWEKLIVYF